MAERKLSLIILGKATGALAAMKSVGDEAGSLGKKMTNLLPSFKTVALAGAAAFGAVTAAALGAVQAAAQDEQSQKKLADQLKRTTNATAEQIAAAEKHISTLMMQTGTTDDELRPALAALVRATGDVSFAQNQLTLALDISTATGKDLETVSLALGKAFTGNVGALTKLGVPLDQSVVKSKNLSEVIKTLNAQFGGAAADAADTFSGRLRILQTSLGEAVEGIGYALLPFAERLVAFIQTKVVPVIQAFSDKLAAGGGLRDALIAAAAQSGSFGLKVVNALETITKSFATFSNVMISLARPLVFVLGAIASALVLIFTRSFSTYKETAQEFRNLYEQMGDMKISTDTIGVAFENFRNDLLGAAAAATVTQSQLRALEQQQRQQASGGTAVVQAFIGPLLKGYGATATATKTADELNKEFLATLAKLQSSAGGAGGKLKETASQMSKFSDAVIKARDATRAQIDADRAVTDARERLDESTQSVTKAQARFDTVVRGYPATAKETIAATRAYADAQRSVRDAGFQVANATRGVQAAEKALADLRAKQADAQKVASAERSLERSKYDVEEANFRVTDAEKALAAIRLDPDASAIEIRRAEIDLAEAKLAVFDAIQSVTDAEKRLSDERNVAATPEQIAEAEQNLKQAKMQVVDAIDAQTRATEDASAAEQHFIEITQGATEGSEAYEDALRDLESAKKDQEAASRNLADTIRDEADAVRDLATATATLLAVQGNTKAGVQSKVAAGLGVSIGAGGSIIENIATVSANAGAAAAGGATTNVTMNVQAGISNPVETANEIIDALRQWERANGNIMLAI
jgi:hypothetical protein